MPNDERDLTGDELQQAVAERLKELPPQVQNAIRSADVQSHLRELAQTHQLHLDQWTALENEVMFTLLGFEPIAALSANLQAQLNIPAATADAITADISSVVFAPIRAELEHQLESTVPATDQHEAAVAAAHQTAAAPIIPPAAPLAAPIERAVRAPISASYNAGEASHARKVVEGDPYREQLD